MLTTLSKQKTLNHQVVGWIIYMTYHFNINNAHKGLKAYSDLTDQHTPT